MFLFEISDQIENELQGNELAINRCVIIEAAKLLQDAENRLTRDETVPANAEQMAATAQFLVINSGQRFNFNELTAQNHQ